ncbi:helix-turn-helix domain-containing protein [Flavobacterium anhuiense]|uniref:helix-turn-helix domain-containing protein n=1 Tax=Flavobacterium anhuiense TaxID=459526 RepID=UPI000E6BFA15|nr:helix-turn-helix domain-containing protein [Flavobacterium anhuiense]
MNSSVIISLPNSDDTNVIEPVSLMYYNSDTPSINSRINLKQNLFSFLLEGQKSVQYAGTQVKIDANQFLLLSSGNCLMSEKKAAPDGEYSSILLFFDNKLLIDFFMRRPQKMNSLKHKNNQTPIVSFEKDTFLINFIDSLGFMLKSNLQLSCEMRKLKLEELLLHLSEYYPEKIQQLHSLSFEANDDLLIRQAITDGINNTMTVEELAFLCHMSLSTFKRRFAIIYGTSPNKWLLEKRMQKAAQLLKQGDFKVSEIYFELGYESLSSFIQSFKQIHGITPKQYQMAN